MKKIIFTFLLTNLFSSVVFSQCQITYVTPNGNPNALGTMNDPMDISTAVTTAPNGGYIRMAIGTYTLSSPLTFIANQLVIEGGFIDSLAWTKTSSAGATTIFRNNTNISGPVNEPRISAIELFSNTGLRLQDLTIQVENAAPANQNSPWGTTVYGIYLDSCSSYNFTRCHIIAGNASAGLAGSPGSNGVAGSNGQVGMNGDGDNQNFNTNASISIGGASSCGCPGGNGGNGGFNSNTASTAGSIGGCVGGNGGNGGGTFCSLNCSHPSSANGTDGAAGSNGTIGAVGSSGSPGGVTGSFWTPGAQAGQGVTGQCGSGGGGGGGGGAEQGALCNDGCGADGGSGGGGGDGGAGGTGGYGGGSSFGVFLFNNGSNGSINDCLIQTGSAGIGGIGGAGGAGGAGGIGGAGGGGGCDVGSGGNGGNGGAGGAGGAGGSGATGISDKLYLAGGDSLLNAEDNFFILQTQPEIRVSYANCSNAVMQVEAMNTNNATWSIATPMNLINSSTNPTSFSNGSTGYTTISGDFDGNLNIIYTDFVFVNCNAQTSEVYESICEGESTTFNGNQYTDAGDYTDTLVNAQGCDSLVTLHLTVNQNSNSISVNPSNGAQLMSSLPGLTYQWINCATNMNIPNATNANFTVTQNGTYAVVSTDAQGCTGTSNCITINNIGIEENAQVLFNVSPNPVIHQLEVTFSETFSGTIEIYEVNGKKIFTTNIENQSKYLMNLNAPQGVYFMHVIDNFNGTKTVRIVKI
jgi:hypothetical protein